MKKLSLLFLALFSMVLTQSCKKESTDQTANISEDDAKMVAESDVATDNLLDLIDVYGFKDDTGNKSSEATSCFTQTIVRTGSSVEITWEFDANGCEMPNGNVYKGTLTIMRDWDLTAHSVTGSISFDQFYVNDIMIEGSSSFVREINGDGHPQVSHTYDFTITFPNGDTFTRSGERTREFAEGFDTPSRTDDVFLVTGNIHIERRDGTIIDAVITTPLRREVPCRFFVSGTIEITKNDRTAILDFGDGTCDADATLTLPDGTVRVIHL
jgi:hypothetical protein